MRACRWREPVSYAAFLVTVPSALWRVLMILGLLPGTAALRASHLAEPDTMAYVFGLSAVQLLAGYLAIGLVKPWGRELFGRRIPVWLVVTVGTAGGLVVTWLFTISLLSGVLRGARPDQGLVTGPALIAMVACYLPIILWGPLELLATYGYWRCRNVNQP